MIMLDYVYKWALTWEDTDETGYKARIFSSVVIHRASFCALL